MNIIERLKTYMEEQGITASEFERKVKVANGYLNASKNSVRGIGSDIVGKILLAYANLNPEWLLLERGNMLRDIDGQTGVKEESLDYKTTDGKAYPNKENNENLGVTNNDKYLIEIMKDTIAVLKASNVDKDKIIELLQQRLNDK